MNPSIKREVISEGKTKRLFATRSGDFVLVESKDSLTAGNGSRVLQVPNKGALSTATTASLFEFLERNGVKTHFVSEWIEPREMIVILCDMIKLEVVVRGVARGSYLARNPSIEPNQELDPPVVELYYKEDKRHDPFFRYDSDADQFLLYTADQGLEDQEPRFLGRRERLASKDENNEIIADLLPDIEDIALNVYQLLRQAFRGLGAELDDIKLEFGITDEGDLVVADVIDADSFRIRYLGEELSKQVFRDAVEITDELINRIQENYQLVRQLAGQLP